MYVYVICMSVSPKSSQHCRSSVVGGSTPSSPYLPLSKPAIPSTHEKGLPTPPNLYQRRRSSLQYCYQYTRRPSLPRHAFFMYPVEGDNVISSPPPALRHSTSTSTQHVSSPLTPGTGVMTTLTDSTTSPTSTIDSDSSDNSDSKNTLSINPSSLSTQSLIRRTMLLPKSPTSPTCWKRPHYFNYTAPLSPSIVMDACNNGLEGISSKPSTSNLRVLLVDDNDINLQVLAKALKRHMADIFEFMDMVSSGEGAIEKLKQTAYDLILMDIDMPGLNGIDAATWIRRGHHLQDQQLQLELDQYHLDHVLTQNRRAPIVAVTTNMSMEWKKAYLKVGMNGCLPKPISPIILRHSLTQVLTYGSYWDYSTS
ncbi:hypothetical protein [Absidia glauca]|uniref:Response regulatory domain-containing protein n=1 Tax=Absidia glauca TaxID=4829 RepID=A0A168PNU3_ABSGL|nr:hypothetical protein [Absidia glauca]